MGICPILTATARKRRREHNSTAGTTIAATAPTASVKTAHQLSQQLAKAAKTGKDKQAKQH
jgi:hypothetical protein